MKRYGSIIGVLSIICSDEAVKCVLMENQKYFNGIDAAGAESENDITRMTADWFDRYFSGGRPSASELPLAPDGSLFRQEVWKILCGIPYGETVTYGAIARRMAEITGKGRMSAQAVGGAVGHNPISVIIPCHRVVGANGSLTGYGGGIDRKIKLLEHEGLDISRFSIPLKGTAL